MAMLGIKKGCFDKYKESHKYLNFREEGSEDSQLHFKWCGYRVFVWQHQILQGGYQGVVYVRSLSSNTLVSFTSSRGFKKDCPQGILEKKKVLEIYQSFLKNGNAKFFVDQIFRIFDGDNNGCIDFKVVCTHHLSLYPYRLGVHDGNWHDCHGGTWGKVEMGIQDIWQG